MGTLLLVVLTFCFGRIPAISSSPNKVDWCAKELECNGEKNTMCKYRPQKNSGECTDIVPITDKDMRKEILHLHNKYRNRMANGEVESNGATWPKASNMRAMSWDYDLERLALRWVQQCFPSPPHDKCRSTPVFHYSGQNKGWAGATNDFPSPYGSFDGWVGEIELATPSIVDNLVNARGVLHFTQVIWAESFKLGCAAIHSNKKGFKSTTIVCNYGPGGNMIGSPIYARGEPCSSCPKETSCSPDSAYPQLCSTETDSKKPEDIPNLPDINDGTCKLRIFGMSLDKFNMLILSLVILDTHTGRMTY